MGWMDGSGSINAIRVNGTGYNVGADNADSGTQFVDIASSATLTQSFTLSSAQTISFGASFSNRDLSSGGFVVPTTTVEIVNSSNVVVATASLTLSKAVGDETWSPTSSYRQSRRRHVYLSHQFG